MSTTPTLHWTPALALEHAGMDATHREFVDLLAQAQACTDDAALPGLWQQLIEHTQAHFDREDDWMRATGFASENCHSAQHRVVLAVLREAATRNDAALLRTLLGDLALWFPQHVQTMDAALAFHLRSVGYDTERGGFIGAGVLPQQAITGCGGSSCSPARPIPAQAGAGHEAPATA